MGKNNLFLGVGVTFLVIALAFTLLLSLTSSYATDNLIKSVIKLSSNLTEDHIIININTITPPIKFTLFWSTKKKRKGFSRSSFSQEIVRQIANA